MGFKDALLKKSFEKDVVPYLFWDKITMVLVILFLEPNEEIENKKYPCVRVTQQDYGGKKELVLEKNRSLFFNPVKEKIYSRYIINYIGNRKPEVGYKALNLKEKNKGIWIHNVILGGVRKWRRW